jgi:hypothetical protein
VVGDRAQAQDVAGGEHDGHETGGNRFAREDHFCDSSQFGVTDVLYIDHGKTKHSCFAENERVLFGNDTITLSFDCMAYCMNFPSRD